MNTVLQCKTLGCDVSFWQGTMNWNTARQSGIEFAFIKATDGTGGVDPQFKLNWKATRELGLPRGAYHFFRTNLDPIHQATLFVETIESQGLGWGEMSLVVDVEDKGTTLKNSVQARVAGFFATAPVGMTVEQKVKTFTDYVSTHTNGEPVMIYSSPAYITTYFKNPMWSQYPLWIANYVRTAPSIPVPWVPGLEKYWQIGYGDGKFYGAQSLKIDLDVGYV
jgi:lysozyme